MKYMKYQISIVALLLIIAGSMQASKAKLKLVVGSGPNASKFQQKALAVAAKFKNPWNITPADHKELQDILKKSQARLLNALKKDKEKGPLDTTKLNVNNKALFEKSLYKTRIALDYVFATIFALQTLTMQKYEAWLPMISHGTKVALQKSIQQIKLKELLQQSQKVKGGFWGLGKDTAQTVRLKAMLRAIYSSIFDLYAKVLETKWEKTTASKPKKLVEDDDKVLVGASTEDTKETKDEELKPTEGDEDIFAPTVPTLKDEDLMVLDQPD